MVDQMRGDYVERFKGDWSKGLKRLVTQGAWFRNAAYPYLNTVTCAGHATVSTGALPHVHGIVANTWWERKENRLTTCTEDPASPDVTYGPPAAGGESAARLVVPTFTDEMRNQRHAHVVTLSLKARSAIMLAGHGADAVVWLNDALNGWATSATYSKSPVPAVKTFVDANPIAADYGKTWNRILSPSQYHDADDLEAEAPPRGWTRMFPHVLAGTAGAADAFFYHQWETSPYADAYLGRFAAALAESFQLGKHDGTDVLAVSFSSTDIVGHQFGPDSQEVQDMYAHLDQTIGALLDRLDALVGRDQYVVTLTADHGVTAIPEQAMKRSLNAGRLTASAIVDPAEKRAQAAAGAGKYIASLVGNDLYFEPGMYQKLESNPGALDAVIETIAATPGIAKVFRSSELRNATNGTDPLLRAAALSYYEGRSGDLVIALKPGWMFGVGGTTHGSANHDDQYVPVLFMGRGVKPGQYTQAVTPADVAPTLAALCGIALSHGEGHALFGDAEHLSKTASAGSRH